ncbi:unnamed protein product [Gongylonema pulchrum]|uniref:Uncharacterized protein n=1 Tax=Gongylonema pulchrum TaxID=637853 RepID=A0A183D9G2_9BILA|nr:unnamed protein product [Gongylonema pulchrum]
MDNLVAQITPIIQARSLEEKENVVAEDVAQEEEVEDEDEGEEEEDEEEEEEEEEYEEGVEEEEFEDEDEEGDNEYNDEEEGLEEDGEEEQNEQNGIRRKPPLLLVTQPSLQNSPNNLTTEFTFDGVNPVLVSSNDEDIEDDGSLFVNHWITFIYSSNITHINFSSLGISKKSTYLSTTINTDIYPVMIIFEF